MENVQVFINDLKNVWKTHGKEKIMEEYRVNGIIEKGIYQGSYEDIKNFDKRLWRIVPTVKENVMVYNNNQIDEDDKIEEFDEENVLIEEVEEDIRPSLKYQKGTATSKWLNVVGVGKFGKYNYSIKIK